MEFFDNFNLVMFSGKGGVGKIINFCVFVVRWVKKFFDEKVLLIFIDFVYFLGDVL